MACQRQAPCPIPQAGSPKTTRSSDWVATAEPDDSLRETFTAQRWAPIPDSSPMTQVPAPDADKPISLYKGKTNVLDLLDASGRSSPLDVVRKDTADAMNSKNLSFLFGSGCSSARAEDGSELGIPTMAPMAKMFIKGERAKFEVSSSDSEALNDLLGIELEDPKFSSNLESLMEVLYGFRFVLAESKRTDLASASAVVDRVIETVKRFVFQVCWEGQSSDPDRTVLTTYERFYRRLAQRDRALPRPWVFTTNYDLFNETAMDRLGVPYINGFQGSVERRFNPASFRYTIAEQLDISSRKWSSLDSLVYFAKLHGSVSWQSSEEGLFPVVEAMPSDTSDPDRMLIYPTPAKQNASFAAPYSDMFRELQSRVAREQSALITIGYSFGDEHVNNIIFQALTIPTFRLVAFVDPNANGTVQELRSLDDPRIWIVGTEDKAADWKGHYFQSFVDDVMPSSGEDRTDSAIGRVLEKFMRGTAPAAPPEVTNE